jgi:hypothetical protein
MSFRLRFHEKLIPGERQVCGKNKLYDVLCGSWRVTEFAWTSIYSRRRAFTWNLYFSGSIASLYQRKVVHLIGTTYTGKDSSSLLYYLFWTTTSSSFKRTSKVIDLSFPRHKVFRHWLPSCCWNSPTYHPITEKSGQFPYVNLSRFSAIVELFRTFWREYCKYSDKPI